ncbi:MAG: major capsid protein [Rhodoblastus sp.]
MAPNNMNLAQARVVDPILTTQARGYTNAQFIFPRLFPYADIPVRGMKIIRFDQRAFRREDTRRAPGAPTRAVTFGYESDPVALQQDALDAVVPREHQEEAGAVPGIDLASRSIEMVLDKVDLGHEIDCAAFAFNAALYSVAAKTALAGTDKWSDPSSDPAAQVKDYKLTVAKRIGRQPNTMTMGLDVFTKLTSHAKIKEQFKYTSADSITSDMLARYFQIENLVVGEAVYLPDGAADGEALFIWGGGFVQLAYVGKGGSYLEPSYGYSYRLSGYPIVEQPYWDRSRKSWIYGVTQERKPVAAMQDAAFLITGAI